MAEQLRYLELAGLRIRVEAESGLSEDPGILREYLAAPGACDYSLTVTLQERLPEPEGKEVYISPGLRVYEAGEGQQYFYGEAQAPGMGHLCTMRRNKNIEAICRRGTLREGVTAKLLLTALDLPHLLICEGGFLLHASFIGYGDGAILFTAPSGTGKSTQAQLWCDHMGAELVNGDRAAVRIVDGRVFACGTPYSGSSPVRRNVTLPLKAIVCLTQAPENAIRRLRGAGAFRAVWEGCTVHVWDRAAVELATRTVSGVVGAVPVYHLACTPDIRAAELLKHTMEVKP